MKEKLDVKIGSYIKISDITEKDKKVVIFSSRIYNEPSINKEKDKGNRNHD